MLFDALVTPSLKLANRIVMAPLTRSRAVDANTPNALMAEYYGQRATAGLIVTEGTSPSPNGLGYARIPGLYRATDVEGWKLTTSAVHQRGGKIFVQLMHCGRVASVANLPKGAEIVGPSADPCPGEMFTDALGMQPNGDPRAMQDADIHHAIEEYAQAARLAIDAGFDGVELHGANGYLIEQFLNPNVNKRKDGFGHDPDGRNRFAVEVAMAVASAIGPERVGIRLSPYGVFNATGEFPEVQAQYLSLASRLSALRRLLSINAAPRLNHLSQPAPSPSSTPTFTFSTRFARAASRGPSKPTRCSTSRRCRRAMRRSAHPLAWSAPSPLKQARSSATISGS